MCLTVWWKAWFLYRESSTLDFRSEIPYVCICIVLSLVGNIVGKSHFFNIIPISQLNYTRMAHINWLAVIVAAIVYFFFGSLWYQVLFRKPWARESGIKMDNPPKGGAMMKMMLKSFLGNLLAVVALAFLLNYAHGGDWMRSAKIGAVAGFGIAGGTLWVNYNWHGKSIVLWCIDIGYATIGLAIAGMIISAMA